MPTLSETRLAANRLLRDHLYSHLDQAEFHAVKAAPWSDDDAEEARQLLLGLVDVVRRCLAAHADTDTGHCLLCGEMWPCRTVETLHDELVDPRHHFQPLREVEA